MANNIFAQVAPLMERTNHYPSEADILKDLEDRIVLRKKCLKPPYFSYDASLDVYPLTVELENESKRTKPAPYFAVSHLNSFLGIGDTTKLIQSSVAIDQLLNPYAVQVVDGKEVKVKVDRHDNIERYNQIVKDVWRFRRTENTRTKPIIAHEVYDSFTKEGSFRAFTTEFFTHISDFEAFTDVKKSFEELKIELDFLEAHADALHSEIDYVRRKDINSESDLTVCGVYLINSEFKFSSLRIGSVIYIPSLKIGVIGTTRQTMANIPHIGGKASLDRKIKYVINQVLGKTKEFDARFQRLATEQWLELKDFEQYDLRASLNISQEKTDKLIEIIETQGYPKNVFGIACANMKASKEAQTLVEREAYNEIAQRIIDKPEQFEQSIQPKENPEDFIEVARSKTERSSSPSKRKVVPIGDLEQL